MKKYNNILVPGGAGFIGSNVIKEIIDDSNRITVIDNLSTGSRFNIEQFSHLPNYRFIFGDITCKEDIRHLCDEKYDLILNFACPANPPYCFSHPLEIMKTNVYGVFNLVEIAQKSNAVFFQSSTSEVYGDPEVSPQNEEYWGHVNPIGVRACYDEGKRCVESILYDYNRVHGLDIRICRIFNTYGPGMNIEDGRVIVQFIINALNNKPLIINGDGTQTRSFCYIEDLIVGINRILELDNMPDMPINLGSDKEITIIDLAKIIICLTDSKSQIIFQNRTPDDPRRRQANCNYANTLINWKPTICIEDGLKHTIDYFFNMTKV